MISLGTADLTGAAIGTTELTAISLGTTDLWPTQPPAAIDFRYYRFEIVAIRQFVEWEPDPIVQLSEFAVLNEGTRLSGMTITRQNGAPPVVGSEGVDKAGDNDTGTKFVSAYAASPTVRIVYDFGVSTVATGYRWATANDAEWRDPVSWQVAGSDDGVNWTLLDSRTGYATTTARNTFLPDFPLVVTSAGYQVRARDVYDPNGDKVVLRGVEQRFWEPWLDPAGAYIDQIALTGANAVRVIPYYPPETAPTTGISTLTVPQMQNLITRTLNNGMCPVFHIAGAQTAAASALIVDANVKTMVQGLQDRIILDGIGESTATTGTEWADNTEASIAAFRSAGYTCPLIFMSNTYGRNLPTLLDNAEAVAATDPLRNTMFGWQAYWGSPGNYYQNLYGMTLHEAMIAVSELTVPVQVGLLHASDLFVDATQFVDYQTLMADAATYGISWMWWDWALTDVGEDLVDKTNPVYGQWVGTYGEDVAVTNPNGLSGAVRTAYMTGP